MRTALFVFVAIVLGTGIMLGHDFIRAEFMPGTHILYLGFRDFHIWYRYVDPKRYSFINEELDDKIKYYFKKVVDHIILYDMTDYYPKREIIQDLADYYYRNLRTMYTINGGCERGVVSLEDLNFSISYCEEKNQRILDELVGLNKELVEKINEMDLDE